MAIGATIKYGALAASAAVFIQPPAGEQWEIRHFEGDSADGYPNPAPTDGTNVSNNLLSSGAGVGWRLDNSRYIRVRNGGAATRSYVLWFRIYAESEFTVLKVGGSYQAANAYVTLQPPADKLYLLKAMWGDSPQLWLADGSGDATTNCATTGSDPERALAVLDNAQVWARIKNADASARITFWNYVEVDATALTSIGDVVSLAASSYLDLRPAAGQAWQIGAVSHAGAGIIFGYDGVTRSASTIDWSTGEAKPELVAANGYWVQIYNSGGSAIRVGYTGFVLP